MSRHRQRHQELHQELDELVADYMQETGNLASETTVMELMRWSNEEQMASSSSQGTRRISEIEEVVVTTDSSARMYEKAMRLASGMAQTCFGIDDCGHSSKVDEWERSCCSVEVRFKTMQASGGMTGWDYTFVFEAWCEKNEEE